MYDQGRLAKRERQALSPHAMISPTLFLCHLSLFSPGILFGSLIVGGGPAGLSAVLALGRVCRIALVLDSKVYRNEGVTAMHTVLSRDGAHLSEFRSVAVEQIKPYPSIRFQEAVVVSTEHVEVAPGYMGFQATDSKNSTYSGRKLVLATGTRDLILPGFLGYKENWPSRIYQCLFCDGFEQRDYLTGVLTFPNSGYNHLVLMALRFNPDVTIYSNGPVSEDSTVQRALKTALASKAKLGPAKGITINFEDGSSVKLGMLLHRPATRNRGQRLIDQLGLRTRGGSGEIVVDPVFAETSVKECFAAGDSSELVKQVALAMGSGVRAGTVVSMQLCNEEGARSAAALSDSKSELE
ncbi:FAD/NAD(P)-binding domain-containing protein [Polychaeton citri CBS 116435]|uniref:FAD/NAD(P)-binding domain-containing protein n=1 Tax=Polychaeton citri CBS 116435 TaxID=1314669 RepID=A0A9P4PZU0_9PEZI|nr:FAD/NAD(P)-binding domain-containing protein [Polychaeton citri CBS 116435]